MAARTSNSSAFEEQQNRAIDAAREKISQSGGGGGGGTSQVDANGIAEKIASQQGGQQQQGGAQQSSADYWNEILQAAEEARAAREAAENVAKRQQDERARFWDEYLKQQGADKKGLPPAPKTERESGENKQKEKTAPQEEAGLTPSVETGEGENAAQGESSPKWTEEQKNLTQKQLNQLEEEQARVGRDFRYEGPERYIGKGRERTSDEATVEQFLRRDPRPMFIADAEGNVATPDQSYVSPSDVIYAAPGGDAIRGEMPKMELGFPLPEIIQFPADRPLAPVVKTQKALPGRVDPSTVFYTGTTAGWSQKGEYPSMGWAGPRDAYVENGPGYDYFTNAKKKIRGEENRGDKQDKAIYETIDAQADLFSERMYPKQVGMTGEGVSPEQFEEDYANGETEFGRYDDKRSKAEKRTDSAVNAVMKFIIQHFIPLQSQYIDEDGRIRFSDTTEAAIQNYMNKMRLKPSERWLVFAQVAKSIGFCPDRDGFFFNQEGRPKLNDAIFVAALDNMYASQIKYGHPYGYVNRAMALGGTRCFPVGVIGKREAQILCRKGGPCEGMSVYELQAKAAETWLNETYPAIKRNANIDQRVILEDFVRALCALEDVNPNKFGVSLETDRGFQEMTRQCEPDWKPDLTDEDRAVNAEIEKQINIAKRREDRARDRLYRKRNKPKAYYARDIVDDNGGVIHKKGERVRRGDKIKNRELDVVEQPNPVENPFFGTCMAVSNFMRFAGVVGYVPLMASGMAEHAQGTMLTKVANWTYFRSDKSKPYKPLDRMYAMITTEEGVEGIRAWKCLLSVGGQDAVTTFYSEMGNVPLNTENCRKFIEDFVERERKGLLKGKPKELAKKFGQKTESITRLLMPGDVGFGKIDARRWLEGFMINNMLNANDKAGMEQSFTASQVLEMMDADGVDRFIAAATSMNAGRDAMLMTRNMTLDRESPLTHLVDNVMKANGVTNLLVSLAIDKYVTYGMNLVQLMMPFSNTMSYLTVRGINWVKNGNGFKISDRGRGDLESDDLNILNYQMGGNDSFGAGLRKNLIYDFMRFSNAGIMATFVAAIFMIIGFDEPEDEDLKYKWEEYRIGANIGLGGTDENGKPQGIPVYAAWWLNDLSTFSLPLAYAICAEQMTRNGDQKLGKFDADLSQKLFNDGCYSMLTGCSLLDMIKTVTNAHRDIDTLQQMMEDPKVEQPPDWCSYALISAELACARGVNNLIPNAIKNIPTDTMFVGQDALDRTPYEVYDRSYGAEPGDTEKNPDWYDIQRRIESKYNIPYAIWNNFSKNYYIFDDGSTDKTGYLLQEMPIYTDHDQRMMAWAEKFDYDPDNIPGGEKERNAYTIKMIEQVMKEIDNFDSVEEAINQGFFIPAQLRIKMGQYLQEVYYSYENIYNSRRTSGYYKVNGKTDWDKQNADYEYFSKKKQETYKYISTWVRGDLPWTSKAYAKLLSDNETVYYYKDSNAPASVQDYILLGPDAIEKRYVAKGNHPTSYLPFTMPETRDRGFNYETIPVWYAEGESGTDLDKAFKDMEGQTVPLGRDQGVPVNVVNFGATPDVKIENEPEEPSKDSGAYKSLNQPTINRRARIKLDEELFKDLPNARYGWEEVAQKAVAENGGGNGNGNASSSSSSSSSNSAGNSTGNGNGSDSDSELPNFNKGMSYSAALKAALDKSNFTGNGLLGKLGKYIPKSEWDKKDDKNNSYNKNWKYYSSGGGYKKKSGGSGSSYQDKPKIYNTAHSTNFDRASTMYSSNPYSVSTSYLRPSFATKGSREAGRREDF